MKNRVNVKEYLKATVHEAVNTDKELCKVGAIVTAAFVSSVGIWAIICLSSAFLSEGGPIELVRNLVGAVSGTM